MKKFQSILLVEDDRFISDLYLRALNKEGYTTDLATTGPEGFTATTKRSYDLILLDIMIPDMTGIELLSKLRPSSSAKNSDDTKIVIITNLDQDEDSRAHVESLSDGYLIKANVTPRKLVEIIHELEETGEIKDRGLLL